MKKSSLFEEPLKAALFDMDGVLCDTDEYHYRSWKQVFDAHDIPFSRSVNDHLRGLTRRASLEWVLGDRPLSEEDKKRILEEKNARYLELIRALGPANLLPGVAGLLQELSSHGMLIGVASASQNVEGILERLGIASLVKATCRGNQLARTKPAPDPYLYIARRLDVLPQACLVIEDSQAGVQSGVAAGMCVLGVGSNEHLYLAYAVKPGLDGMNLKKLRAIHRRWLAESGQKDWASPFPSSQKSREENPL